LNELSQEFLGLVLAIVLSQVIDGCSLHISQGETTKFLGGISCHAACVQNHEHTAKPNDWALNRIFLKKAFNTAKAGSMGAPVMM